LDTLAVASILASVSVAIVGIIRELWLQYSKLFTLVVNTDKYPVLIKISLRNNSSNAHIIDKICIYCYGDEINFTYRKNPYGCTISGNEEFKIDGNGKADMYIASEDLKKMKQEASIYIHKHKHPFLSLIYTYELPEEFSFKLLIRSSGEVFLTRKWIPTESFVINNEQEDISENEVKLSGNKIKMYVNLMVRLIKVASNRWHTEPSSLKYSYSFKRRFIDSKDPQGYIAIVSTFAVYVLAVLILVPFGIEYKITIYSVLMSVVIVVMTHRASTGIVKRSDKFYAFFAMWFASLLFLGTEVTDLLSLLAYLIGASAVLFIIVNSLINYFGGINTGLWSKRVKRY